MNENLNKKVGLSLSIYSNNIYSIISIYNDSASVRTQKIFELFYKLNLETRVKEDFERFNHYLAHFRWLLLHSLFIAGYSYFESYMRDVASFIEVMSENKIKLKDIRGNGDIDTYRKYINLVGNIDSTDSDKKEWQIILEFKQIRNAIIHKSGVIDKKIDKALEHHIYDGPDNYIIRMGSISFLEDFAKTSTRYMKLIADGIG